MTKWLVGECFLQNYLQLFFLLVLSSWGCECRVILHGGLGRGVLQAQHAMDAQQWKEGAPAE